MSAVRNKNLRPKNLPADSVTTLNFPNNSNASSGTNSNNNRNTTSKFRPLTATKSKLGPYTPRVENLKNRVKRIKQQLPSVRNVRPATKRAPNNTGPRPSPNVRPATKKRKIIPNGNVRPATANNKNNATRIIKNSKKQIENNKKSLLNIRKTIQKAQNTLKIIKKPTPTKKRAATPVATNNKVLTTRKRTKPNRYDPTPTTPAKKTRRTPARQVIKKPSTISSGNKNDVLLNFKNLKNKDEIEQGLYFLYNSEASEPMIKNLYGGKNREYMNNIVKSQLDLLRRRQWPKLSSKTYTLKPKNDEDFEMDFMFLVWLDMRHDGTITGSFKKFLESEVAGVLSKSNSKKMRVKITPMIERILDLYKDEKGKLTKFSIVGAKKDDINVIKSNTWESTIKNHLDYIFELEDDMYEVDVKRFNPDIFRNNITSIEDKIIYVGIDQEENDTKTISQALMSTKIRAGEGNGKYTNKKLKLLQPYVTVAHMLDPGKTMPMLGIKGDLRRFMSPGSRTVVGWNFSQNEFHLGKNLTVSVDFNPSEGRYILTVNNTKVIPGISKGDAQKQTATSADKISKFMGDFLQNLYISSIAGPAVKSPVAIGTGDGMMSALYTFVMKRVFGKSPKLILDMSISSKIRLIGMDNIISKNKLTKVNRNNSTVGQPNNRKNTSIAVNRTRRGGIKTGNLNKLNNESGGKKQILNRFIAS